MTSSPSPQLPPSFAITGATGFVGAALARAIEADGAAVLRVSRQPGPGRLVWDPARGHLDAAPLAGIPCVVHLAGEGIAAGRWTRRRKEAIRRSRWMATDLLARSLATLRPPPAVLLSASAIGIYGDRGEEALDETSPTGSGFLAEVGRGWEAATLPAADAGIRVVHLRLGVVLGAGGGALARMLPIFRLGLGGPLGNGHQWMSWIGLDDAVRAIRFLADGALAGAVNLVSPHPVRNGAFSTALGRAVRRPARVPVPRFALRLALGALADEALLASQRVIPRRLTDAGFVFAAPTLPEALAALLEPSP